MGETKINSLLNAYGGISLNESTPQASGSPAYILGIKNFAEGGQVIWQTNSSVTVGKADALTINAGSTTAPVYFTNGIPTVCSGIVVPGIKSANSVGTLGWGTNNNYVPDISFLAYWNGAYSGTASNLTYYRYGVLGKIATYSETDFLRYYDNAGDQTSLDVVNTPTYLHTVSTSGGTPTTATKPTGIDNAWGVLHMHTHSGNYATQLGFGGTTRKMYFRNAYNTATFDAWTELLDSTGGTVTGNINKLGTSASWINGRDKALCRLTTYSAYSAITSMKTTNGSWEMGVYTNDRMYFTYAPDSNYSSNNNTGYTQIRLEPSGVLYGAAWNDYAEFRESEIIEPGRVVIETGNGDLILSTERLQAGANVISDTFGFAIGETEDCRCPIAVSGRVLVYPNEDRESYKAGEPVCSGPNGTVSKMTREEVRDYPDRIVGTVSEIPNYEVWGQNNVKVNNRIWIKVK